jgi:hypothetical protein
VSGVRLFLGARAARNDEALMRAAGERLPSSQPAKPAAILSGNYFID